MARKTLSAKRTTPKTRAVRPRIPTRFLSLQTEAAIEDERIWPFVVVGLVGGAALGAAVGGLGGDLALDGEPSDWAQVGLYPAWAILLVAACHTRDLGLGKALLLAPAVAAGHLCTALIWLAAYFFVLPAPALIVFSWFYWHPPITSWPPERFALLVALLVLAGFIVALSRLLPAVFERVAAFYDHVRAVGLVAAALFAAAPALVIGVLFTYHLGFLNDPSWSGGFRSSMVGATLGAAYGASVGFFGQFTVLMFEALSESDD